MHEVGLGLVTDENGRRGLYWKGHFKPICQLRDTCPGGQYHNICIDDALCCFDSGYLRTLGYETKNSRLSENLRPKRLGTGDQRMGSCHCIQRPFFSRIQSRLRGIF
ncbi:hypothetical protein D3C81_1771530 [compost metagenome]